MYDKIISRRSIRKFKNEPVSKELIIDILKAGMYAPSAMNQQAWQFVIVENKETIKKLIEVHPHAQLALGSPVTIFVCGDKNLATREQYVPIDCAAVTENILLASHAKGLGACWLGIYPVDERVEALNSLLNLPEGIFAFSGIAIGYPDEEKPLPERFYPDRIHYEKW